MSFPGGIGQGLNPVGLLGRILARASNASFGDEFPPLGEEAFPDWNEPRLRDAAKGGDGLVPILPILEKLGLEPSSSGKESIMSWHTSTSLWH